MRNMLLFVYNTRSGRLNAAFDAAHKWLKPETYPCSLCKLTHGVVGEKELWKRFRESVEEELQFFHKDDYLDHFQETVECPAVVRFTDAGMKTIMSAEQLNQCETLEELIQLLQRSME